MKGRGEDLKNIYIHIMYPCFYYIQYSCCREVDEKYNSLYDVDRNMDDKQQLLVNLTNNLDQKQQVLNDLDRDIETKQQLIVELKNKEQLFFELDSKIKDGQQKIEMLAVELTDKSVMLKTIETETIDAKLKNINEIDEASKELDILSSRISDKSFEIFTLERTLEEKREAFTNNIDNMEKIEAEHVDKKVKLDNIDAIISKQTLELEDCLKRTRTIEADLRLKTTELQRLESNVNFKSAELVSLENDIHDKKCLLENSGSVPKTVRATTDSFTRTEKMVLTKTGEEPFNSNGENISTKSMVEIENSTSENISSPQDTQLILDLETREDNTHLHIYTTFLPIIQLLSKPKNIAGKLPTFNQFCTLQENYLPLSSSVHCTKTTYLQVVLSPLKKGFSSNLCVVRTA